MKRRKITAAIILLGGVALFFVIVNAKPSSRPLVAAQAGAGMDGSLAYTVSAGGGNAGGASNSNAPATQTNNLTDLLTQNYARTILQMNNGFSGASATGTNNVSFPSVDSTSQLLSQAVSQKLQYKTYTPGDILVSSDNSTSSQLQYLANVSAVTQKDFGPFKTPIDQMVANAVNNNDNSAINQYVAMANQEVADLLSMRVPSNWATWHLSNINLWEEKIAAFTAIAGLNDDPVKAIAALNGIVEIFTEHDALNQTMQQRYKILIS